jgi:FkbM family methyltransferase
MPPNRAIALARRLGRQPGIRALLEQPAVEREVSTFLRSSVVRESPPFLARELLRRRVAARYHLRASGRAVWLRHSSPDIPTLDEVFYQRQYEVPAAILDQLRGLGRRVRVLDLGANIGLFAAFISELLDVELTAVEPDRANFELLRRTSKENGGWRLIEAAAATKDGTVPFAQGGGSLSHVDDLASDHVDAIDVFPLLEEADLVKMDIEASEWPILKDARLAGSSRLAMVLEYHPAPAVGSSDAREAAVTALEAAGFVCTPVLHHEHGAGVLWATRGYGGEAASSNSTGTSTTSG